MSLIPVAFRYSSGRADGRSRRGMPNFSVINQHLSRVVFHRGTGLTGRPCAPARQRPSFLDLTHDSIFFARHGRCDHLLESRREEQFGWMREEALGQVSTSSLRDHLSRAARPDQGRATAHGPLGRGARSQEARWRARRFGQPLVLAAGCAGAIDRFWRPTTTSPSANRRRRICSRPTQISSASIG